MLTTDQCRDIAVDTGFSTSSIESFARNWPRLSASEIRSAAHSAASMGQPLGYTASMYFSHLKGV